MLNTIAARDLSLGRRFTSLKEHGKAWFTVEKISVLSDGRLDVLGRVVEYNQSVNTPYHTGFTKWFCFKPDDLVVI